MLAKRRIEEWDVHWDSQVYLSFSGGLDSTVLLALIRPTEEGGLGMRRVLEYMDVPYETWESVGQMKLSFDGDNQVTAA